MQIFWDAVKVKNAALMYHAEPTKDVYELQHYSTIILVVHNRQVIEFRPVSSSSSRAINQALEYIGINETVKSLKKRFIDTGKPKLNYCRSD